MKLNVVIDWKFVAVLGVAAVALFSIEKMDSDATKEVLIHAIDTTKELKITIGE